MKVYIWYPIGVVKTTFKVTVFLLTLGAIVSFGAGVIITEKTCKLYKDWGRITDA